MKYSMRVVVVVFLFILTVNSSSQAKEQNQWQGYLIDHMCMKAIAQSPDPLDFVQNHTKDCVLMPACREEGFVLYRVKDKKWFGLNKQGNKLAEKLIRDSKRDSAFYVKLKGKLKKNVLQVETINEVEIPKKKI